jgi:phenylalanyl-tRNA synthetase beta chain
MKISVNWLREFMPSFSPEIPELVDRLTYLGLEVEEVFEQSLPDSRIVVGKVVEVLPHSYADRLKVCKVDTGEEELQQIVCGAPNVAAGMTVPVAGVGAVLKAPSGEAITIKPAKIRGVASSGMICAADELGLSDDHTGVMVLDDAWIAGEPLASYLTSDVVLDIAVTPNRPDALSHLGIARELAEGGEIVCPPAASVDFGSSGPLVEVLDLDACPYYAGTVIRGITVAPSPRWLAGKLEQIGLRPRNNIVDITNYILHAFGQPLHAFDLDKLAGGRVIVRSDTDAGITAINQNAYRLAPGITAICDEAGPVAIAGVMGGLDSAVSNDTVDILLEAAYFSPASIRSASKRLQLSSDSSYRYERGVDPCNVRRSAEYAIALILEIAGGAVVQAQECGSMPCTPKIVSLRPERVNAMLGISLTGDRMEGLLGRIGFSAVSRKDGEIAFSVPSYRVDVEQEIDLVEEVARLYGYNRIEPSATMVSSYPVSRKVPGYFPDYLRTVMIGMNYHEVLTNPLVRRQEAELFEKDTVAALNPISEGLEVLRPNLAVSLLKVAAHNIRHGNRDLRLFEVAHGFGKGPSRDAARHDSLASYRESETLSFLLTGRRFPRLWNHAEQPVDFFDVRGSVEMLLRKLNLLDKSALNIYNENTIGIEIALAGQGKTGVLKAGVVQQIGSDILDAFSINQDVFLAEIDVSILEQCFDPGVVYEPPSKFPAVERDLSFVLPRNITVQSIVELVKSSDSLIRSVSVFDVFERRDESGNETGERSVAISLVLSDASGTMNDERIQAVISKVSSNAMSELGAVIRQV